MNDHSAPATPEDTLAKGSLGDLARHVGTKLGLVQASAPSMSAEMHTAHAAKLGRARTGSTTPSQGAALHSLSQAHTQLAHASTAQEAGNHALARKHANLAANYHAQAVGHSADTAAAHGGELTKHLNLTASAVGSRTVNAPKSSAPTPHAGPAAAPAPHFEASVHTRAAAGLREAKTARGLGSAAHGAYHALAQGHDHAAAAIGALQGGNTRAFKTHLQHAQQSHEMARQADSGLALHKDGGLGAHLQKLQAHASTMSKADEGSENRFAGLAEYMRLRTS